jgi:hypothetical protein
MEGEAMEEQGSESAESNPQRREFGSAEGLIHMANDFDEPLFCEAALADWNRAAEDAAWAHLQQPSEGAVTPMLEQAIRVAKELPDEDQDALGAEILEWIEDKQRWAESFARTHEALANLAREALAEHHASQTRDLEADYAEMAADESREADAVEWTEGLIADGTDEADKSRLAADE